MASDPKVLILTGFGLNCETESAVAWQNAGAQADRLHLNDLFEDPDQLQKYQALTFIGGFSFGDHMGSGHVFAARIRHRIFDSLMQFVDRGGLVLGICNGFQIMVKLGLLPGLVGDRGTQRVALMQNTVGHFQNRWVTVRFDSASPCVFTQGLDQMDLPIRHGEGKLHVPSKTLLADMEEQGCVVCRYVDPATGEPTTQFPANPNASRQAIAGLCDSTGRMFGLMPHPEAFLHRVNHPQWSRKESTQPDGDGLKLFVNAVNYLRNS